MSSTMQPLNFEEPPWPQRSLRNPETLVMISKHSQVLKQYAFEKLTSISIQAVENEARVGLMQRWTPQGAASLH